LWIDTTVHLSIDGQHLKPLPPRLTNIDLAPAACSRRPTGPPPARPSWTPVAVGAPVEIHRTVNATATVFIAGKHRSIGQDFPDGSPCVCSGVLGSGSELVDRGGDEALGGGELRATAMSDGGELTFAGFAGGVQGEFVAGEGVTRAGLDGGWSLSAAGRDVDEGHIGLR
jgi:hypothetical protein